MEIPCHSQEVLCANLDEKIEEDIKKKTWSTDAEQNIASTTHQPSAELCIANSSSSMKSLAEPAHLLTEGNGDRPKELG